MALFPKTVYCLGDCFLSNGAYENLCMDYFGNVAALTTFPFHLPYYNHSRQERLTGFDCTFVLQSSQEKLKTMLIQNLWGVYKVHYG